MANLPLRESGWGKRGPDGQRMRVLAMLGPTNTGKTHFAIERLLGHRTGMIGFPLRLLARENYDRVVALKGAAAVALVTGEEKILPPHPRYWICTVESMPLDREVACLAIDEIQLAADPERGHVFTDRLLHARGAEETLFLGSDTARGLVQRLVPGVEFIQRTRLSTLSYTGARKLTRLPPRSAVVAFSATEVYETAELIRRQRGGTAVVLGALSPRTRNAQVAMYQAGEVDYLVATDAIGMGLNMDIDHVAFARLTKFDGQYARKLKAPEIAQIAGRAGRHMTDGTFGTTGTVGELDPALVEAVEEHRFDPLKYLMWRNSDLDFRSLERLLRSLDAPPPTDCLKRAREADDHRALAALARDPEILKRASGPAVGLLWDVCQIPDFRKVMSDHHARLLAQIFLHLADRGRLPPDWVEGQVERLGRVDGDIDTLVTRIAHVRTWTYIAHRPSWIADPTGWQERTRAIEDRLSDALHERLTQRFVDRRAAGLVRSLARDGALLAGVKSDGSVVVEGHPIGRLDGFRFTQDATALGADARPVLTAARRALRSDIAIRVAAVEQAADAEFGLGPSNVIERADVIERAGAIEWGGAPIARLSAGGSLLRPRIVPVASDLLIAGEGERIRDRTARWLESEIARRFPMIARIAAAELSGAARGLAFQLTERLEPIERAELDPLIREIEPETRRALARIGIVVGRSWVFLPGLLKPDAVRLRAALWRAQAAALGALPDLPAPGRVSVPIGDTDDRAYWLALGYPVVAARAIRVDMLERLVSRLVSATVDGVLRPDPAFARMAGCGGGEMDTILQALGWAPETIDGVPLYRRRRRGLAARRRQVDRRPAAGSSPFAVLERLVAVE